MPEDEEKRIEPIFTDDVGKWFKWFKNVFSACRHYMIWGY